MCESGGRRKGIEVRVGPGDRERLEAVIGSGNSPQKHVWRARIVLVSADGVGTMAIQPRFMAEGIDGLLHEATRACRHDAAVGRDDRAGDGDDGVMESQQDPKRAEAQYVGSDGS